VGVKPVPGQPVTAGIRVVPLAGVPLVEPGDDLIEIIGAAIAASGLAPGDGDVVCVAQKIVSKAEGRLVALRDVTPGAAAIELAKATDKDPRLVQLILDESTDVVRHKPGVLLVRHRLGIVCAQAGIDQSNIEHGAGAPEDERALLLPIDPDASAALLRAGLEARFGVRLGVVITDSNNRPWRLGSIGSAIGCSGIRVLDDRRGQSDMFGRELKVTLVNRADALATMATLVMGESTEMTPVALVQGFPPEAADEPARSAVRALEEDMFR
jgi:coenzyme F420-0:L-glutamate ligase/coenzyme F420-1:gamma-L-glutamate ligase